MRPHFVCLGVLVVNLSLSPLGSVAAEQQPASITVAIAGVAHIHAPDMIKKIKARGDVRVKWLWDADAKQAQEYAAQAARRSLDWRKSGPIRMSPR